MSNDEQYLRAQHAISELKSCIYARLSTAGSDGLTNAEVGRSLGIYMGMIDKDKPTHEGHISRVLLGIMVKEGTVQQLKNSKNWVLWIAC